MARPLISCLSAHIITRPEAVLIQIKTTKSRQQLSSIRIFAGIETPIAAANELIEYGRDQSIDRLVSILGTY